MFLPPCLVSAKGRGTVVTGRVEQGTIKVGEEVEVLGTNTGRHGGQIYHVMLMTVLLYSICFCIYQS